MKKFQKIQFKIMEIAWENLKFREISGQTSGMHKKIHVYKNETQNILKKEIKHAIIHQKGRAMVSENSEKIPHIQSNWKKFEIL
ncbi:MAG: hypothetical protein N4A57_16315 [Anaeromicrobium sp.]|jgi:predicted  nucleic acid-binding Zn ribbon protein|uniref:hypothetical protein n=1 Tax=Anaeromicrobium sp. TaxID=1929132 RepID=UPI0025D58EC1|nr:hypothetical protein [Anaeromicrobium sp.]MCT4595812.1 hypothetical protein [Anaeromicrobium sp.]